MVLRFGITFCGIDVLLSLNCSCKNIAFLEKNFKSSCIHLWPELSSLTDIQINKFKGPLKSWVALIKILERHLNTRTCIPEDITSCHHVLNADERTKQCQSQDVSVVLKWTITLDIATRQNLWTIKLKFNVCSECNGLDEVLNPWFFTSYLSRIRSALYGNPGITFQWLVLNTAEKTNRLAWLLSAMCSPKWQKRKQIAYSRKRKKSCSCVHSKYQSKTKT